ncbi:UNVERIFIED_CONTAM: hypothetical protein GTU68_014995 [Idotea baltica]|nr:hypothetical protein [Idotea baltica]
MGAAIAKRLNGDDNLVYSLHGDGELQEGQIWEAVIAAAHLKVDNLIATIDRNFQQIDGNTEDVMALGQLRPKFEAFGWTVLDMDGHDFEAIQSTMAEARSLTGLTLGEDGATHQVLEDVGMMRMLPGMTVVVPCDYNQTRLATLAIAEVQGPCYLRFGRPKWEIFTPAEDETFQIGKAQLLTEGTDVTIFANGHLVWLSLKAAEILESQGISAEVINIHTIKPLDVDAIIASATKTGAVVTAEEHMRNGGLGDAVAQTLSRSLPTPQEFVAVDDSFGESGTAMDLLKKYGLDTNDIVEAAHRVIERK